MEEELQMKKLLEPQNTEEVRPGIFVQEKSPNKYRVVHPIVWKGQWRIKKQFSWRTLFTLSIILFIAWSYWHDTTYARELQENPCELLPSIINYCNDKNLQDGEWTNTPPLQTDFSFAMEE